MADEETRLLFGFRTEELVDIRDSLDFGLELARSSLIEHDMSLGRTTSKNRYWAGVLEEQIKKIGATLDLVKARLGDTDQEATENENDHCRKS